MNEIAARLGVAKSTAYLWTRHLPLDPALVRRRREIAQQARSDAQWAARRAARDAARAEETAAAAGWVRRLSRRELLLIGAAIYWCEGGKAKPWRPNDCRIKFVNSDPMLVGLFLRFLDAVEVSPEDRRFRVSIHETADDGAAVRWWWWADRVGVPADRFQRTTIKRHRPATTRKNVGADYRGCLVVHVVGGSRLYWRIEGIMKGMSGEDPPRDR
ncbi:resolvase [Micromonospora sp. NPDC051300]|uniref:resolvase n=1 Tax=Micromonospora sp. NPDC051300 TaxID=3364286 RepID=UPI0037A198C4